MVERTDLVIQVMHWEADATATKDFLQEAKFTRGLDIANTVNKALAKFKRSDEFTALLKKVHDAEVEAIFYKTWAYYQDLDYTFLGGKLTDLIGEWLEEEKFNAPNVAPSPTLPSHLARNAGDRYSANRGF